MPRILRFGLPAVAAWMLALLGCQPAARYSPAEKTAVDKHVPPAPVVDNEQLSDDITWLDPRVRGPRNPMRIVFVAAEGKSADEWNRLNKFWTQASIQMVGDIGTLPLAPLPIPGLIVTSPDPQVIKIKVPRGLPDPTPLIPEANPPTLPKWELGRQLFYDSGWLTVKRDISCADCHKPDRGFTAGGELHWSTDTPTLVNTVYNTRIFWDGRGRCLEEVVARSLEDERKDSPHAWSGVVTRLVLDEKWKDRFQNAIGTQPTQDAVAKVLATYLRTLLAGNSIHDRAVHNMNSRSGKALEKGDYEAVVKALAPAERDSLGVKNQPNAAIAADLLAGHALFHNLGCANCHPAPLYADGRFHNVGVLKGDDYREDRPKPGHFRFAPIGLRESRLIGAYKTPTLRGLSRTAPYFHTGACDTLEKALIFHTEGFNYSSSLAQEFRKGDRWDSEMRKTSLSADEMRVLLLFLRSLDGGSVDSAVLPPK